MMGKALFQINARRCIYHNVPQYIVLEEYEVIYAQSSASGMTEFGGRVALSPYTPDENPVQAS